ncbi:MAG: hypothetical protein GXP33_13520 [Spirochaetes bacterium]|nr:hypothetical protein [Spirochaetota bacterium]
MLNSVKILNNVIRKIFVFLFISIAMLVFLYLLGNRQEFLDSTQMFLLRMINYTSSLCFPAGIVLLLLYIFLIIKLEHIRIVSIILVCAATVFSLGILLGVKFISVWLSFT